MAASKTKTVLGSGKIKIALVDPDNNGLTNTSVIAIQNARQLAVVPRRDKPGEYEIDWDPTSAPVLLWVSSVQKETVSGSKVKKAAKSTKKATGKSSSSNEAGKGRAKPAARKAK